MKKRSRPWEDMRDLVNHSIDLTDFEAFTMDDAISRVVRSIFRREKNPLKVRILLSCIANEANMTAIRLANEREARAKRKALKLKAKGKE